jgi:hypothetical protein
MKKHLISFLCVLMAVTLAVGMAGCGKENTPLKTFLSYTDQYFDADYTTTGVVCENDKRKAKRAGNRGWCAEKCYKNHLLFGGKICYTKINGMLSVKYALERSLPCTRSRRGGVTVRPSVLRCIGKEPHAVLVQNPDS